MGGGSALQNLTELQNLTLGCMAGVGAKMTNYPLLVAKNNVQQGIPISYNPKVVYRGLPMACMNLGGTTAVQFWATGSFLARVAALLACTRFSDIAAKRQ